MWSIWKAQNKFIFENYAGSPVETLTHAVVTAKDWDDAQEKCMKVVQSAPQSPSLQADTIVRTDAAWAAETKKCRSSVDDLKPGTKRMTEAERSFYPLSAYGRGPCAQECSDRLSVQRSKNGAV